MVGLFDLIAHPAPFTGSSRRENCFSRAVLLNSKLFSHKLLTKEKRPYVMTDEELTITTMQVTFSGI